MDRHKHKLEAEIYCVAQSHHKWFTMDKIDVYVETVQKQKQNNRVELCEKALLSE